MTTTDDDVFLAFERWAEARGVRFARDACVVKRDAHRGAWIEGARDGGRGEILLEVPKSACLSTTTSALGDGGCLLYTSPSPRDRSLARMPSSA